METEVREPAVAYGKQKFSIEEYLEMEKDSTFKHEYYNGEIFLMAGTKADHNTITINLIVIMRHQLKGGPCRVFSSDMRVNVDENDLYTYPDLSIVCGQPTFRDNDQFNLKNPSVIIEVLSRSTKEYDRGDKFKLYQELRSLKEYILVDSQSVLVEHFIKNEQGEWIRSQYSQLSDTFIVEAADVALSVKEIYEDTQFPKLTHNSRF